TRLSMSPLDTLCKVSRGWLQTHINVNQSVTKLISKVTDRPNLIIFYIMSQLMLILPHLVYSLSPSFWTILVLLVQDCRRVGYRNFHRSPSTVPLSMSIQEYSHPLHKFGQFHFLSLDKRDHFFAVGLIDPSK